MLFLRPILAVVILSGLVITGCDSGGNDPSGFDADTVPLSGEYTGIHLGYLDGSGMLISFILIQSGNSLTGNGKVLVNAGIIGSYYEYPILIVGSRARARIRLRLESGSRIGSYDGVISEFFGSGRPRIDGLLKWPGQKSDSLWVWLRE